jgi:hypothetical protein
MNRARDEQSGKVLDQPVDATLQYLNKVVQSPLTSWLYAHYRK